MFLSRTKSKKKVFNSSIMEWESNAWSSMVSRRNRVGTRSIVGEEVI